jgi:hypothetical protein
MEDMKNLFITLFFILGLAFGVKAGSGVLSSSEKYCSENEKYCLEIELKEIESESSDAEDESDEDEAVVEESEKPENYAKATFFANNREVWTVRLDYTVSPARTLISNDGDYIVTFEDLYTTVSGDNAVVIYSGSSGKVIKKVGLSDFLTKSDISNLRDGYNLYDWQRKPPVIDYARSELVLSVVNPPRGSEDFFNVRIDLTNGAVIDEVIDRISTTKYIFITKEVEETINPIISQERKNECESEEIEQLSTFDFSQKILQKELPEYPAAARAVRAFGEVVFEVVISPEGEVACISAVSGHPLLRSALSNALKKWKFEKRETKYKGNIIFASKIVTTLNGKIIE